jgi:hypothetical protein
MTEETTLTPNNDIFDIIKDEFKLRNDRELSEFLEITPSVLSRLRHGKMTFTPTYLLAVHDATDWSLNKIRGYLPGSSIQ